MILRYPGGKSKGPLSDLIVDSIRQRYTRGIFGELFFGGGGITLKLLKLGVIDHLLINEKDVTLARLWNAVISNPDRLVEEIHEVEPSVELFESTKRRVKKGVASGLEALIVNRMSHGGRGAMGGPQGGLHQKSQYTIDCRWSPEFLCKKVLECSRLFSSVDVIGRKCHVGDYERYLELCDWVYLDPPYWEKGKGLYLKSFAGEDHQRLRRVLDDWNHWILSYNNVPEIRELYAGYPQEVASVKGNGGIKEGSELLITCGEH